MTNKAHLKLYSDARWKVTDNDKHFEDNKSFSKPCYSYTSSLPLESQNTLPHIGFYMHLLLRQDVVIQKRCSSKSPSRIPQFINPKFISTSPIYDAPKLWNDLPLEIQTAPTLSCFKSDLKAICFRSLFLLVFFLLLNTDDPLVMTLLWFMTYDYAL